MASIENMALWHERDISHSSVERIIFPDCTILLDYMLNLMVKLINNLIIYPENMKKNLLMTHGLIYSQRILLELAKKGITREKAYELVQRNALKSWEEGIDFYKLISTDKEVKKLLTKDELDICFDLEYHLEHVDTIFKRIFKQDSKRR